MSRCFPFPPPGYEKKARSDEADILAKEKHKEKKHKKEKKDKEKKEKKDKEKKEKKDKKDRKEKQKDKKNDKDRDKDKDKTSDEKRIEGRPEGYKGEKIDQNSKGAEEIKDSKFVQDLGRKRVRDAAKGTGVQMLENFAGTKQRKAEGMARVVENDVDNNTPEGKEKYKVGADQRRAEVGMVRVVEKDVSNRVEGKEKNKDGMGRQRAENMARVVGNVVNLVGGKGKNKDGMDQQRADGMARVVENAVNWAEGKEKNEEKKNDDRKADVQRNRDEESVGHAKVRNFIRVDQQRVEGMVRPMEKDAEKRLERKEKKKNKEGSDKKRDKHKEKDREKKSKGKDEDKSKEKYKEKEEEKIYYKNKEQDKLKERSKDPINTLNTKTSTLNFSRESSKSSDTDGNLRKRKDIEMNGFLHGSDIRPNKLSRSASSSPLLTENGKKVEPCQPAIQFTSEKQGQPNNLKAEYEEHKVNGIIEAQRGSVRSTKTLPTAQAIENGETSTKRPHPDLKYLSEILSVPKMEEWSDFDDQEWLFSSDSLQLKKPNVGSSVVEEIPQVWAEALRIESADEGKAASESQSWVVGFLGCFLLLLYFLFFRLVRLCKLGMGMGFYSPHLGYVYKRDVEMQGAVMAAVQEIEERIMGCSCGEEWVAVENGLNV
ncbi:hypothetical protein NE237_011085 [Protea cynaroides]|uniref:Uncharacterized protein n=1 Tax=Protea cynaroides TaxID=273540 RepID=A0A9Q0JWP4_9MAGN|nr:hypothetical protein NE237_011085 [Protea cynaroides]